MPNIKGTPDILNKIVEVKAELNSAIATGLSAKAGIADLQAKADVSYVDSVIANVGSGSPKGVYATVSALTNAYPTGDSNVYVVSADGKWYYWNGSAWTAGGVYQASNGELGELVETNTELKNSTVQMINSTSSATVHENINRGVLIEVHKDSVFTGFEVFYGSMRADYTEGIFTIQVHELDYETQLSKVLLYRDIKRTGNGTIVPSEINQYTLNIPLKAGRKYAIVGASVGMNVYLRQSSDNETAGIDVSDYATTYSRFTLSNGLTNTIYDNFYFRKLKFNDSKYVMNEYHYPETGLIEITDSLPIVSKINKLIMLV